MWMESLKCLEYSSFIILNKFCPPVNLIKMSTNLSVEDYMNMVILKIKSNLVLNHGGNLESKCKDADKAISVPKW